MLICIRVCLGRIAYEMLCENLMRKIGIMRKNVYVKLECGQMPNVMAALPNIDGAVWSTSQSLADAHY